MTHPEPKGSHGFGPKRPMLVMSAAICFAGLAGRVINASAAGGAPRAGPLREIATELDFPVRDFGAIPDDAESDAAAIQAAQRTYRLRHLQMVDAQRCAHAVGADWRSPVGCNPQNRTEGIPVTTAIPFGSRGPSRQGCQSLPGKVQLIFPAEPASSSRPRRTHPR